MDYINKNSLDVSCPKVSVVIPVYNSAQYLSHCINSVLRQTINAIEIILVNDGSTDMSGEICDEYAGMDSRVNVTHTENRGVSSARNTGISKAQGKYIIFIDSDDFVENDIVERLVKGLEESHSDFAVTGFSYYYSKEENVPQIYDETNHLTMQEFVAREFKSAFQKNLLSSANFKLYKRKIIQSESLEFPLEFSICEDGIFVYRYLENCQSIFIDSGCLYHYRRESSSTGLLSKYNENAFEALRCYHLSIERFVSKYSVSNMTKQIVNTILLKRYLLFVSEVYKESDLTQAEISKLLLIKANHELFAKLTSNISLSSFNLKQLLLIVLLKLRMTKFLSWFFNY